MAIEGPLRELGIHDVFQLLDLSRKTGLLRVSSELRNDEGTVYFDGGRVVHASIRSLGARPEVALLQAGRITEADIQRAQQRQAKGRVGVDLPDLLVEVGAISAKELERQLRLQIESVVFDLMSWKEGFFSFEERSRDEMPRDRRITVSTESLLMEGARRIDEWSRIAETIPNVNVVPEQVTAGRCRPTASARCNGLIIVVTAPPSGGRNDRKQPRRRRHRRAALLCGRRDPATDALGVR